MFPVSGYIDDVHHFEFNALLFLTFQLPLLDPSQLTDFKDLRLAHLQLVMITAGYAWEQGAEHVAQVTF